METIKLNSRGEAVKTLQTLLNLYPDGIFGPITEEAVKNYQKEHGLVSDGIVGPKTWGYLMEGGDQGLKKSTRKITKIIVHCTATPEGRDVTVEEVRKWHRAQGWSDIGYHYLVDLSGEVHEGRPVNMIGAHTTGHNSNSIGVCYVGGLEKDGKTPKDTRTPAQKDALLSLLKGLKKLYPEATISGHNQWASKACPSFNAGEEYKNL